MRIKHLKFFLFVMLTGASLIVLTGCGDDSSSTSDVASCMNCHSGSSEIGLKILSAQAGYDNSVHKNGFLAPILDDTSGVVIGYEWHGSDAFYANGAGCQICHTHEGFYKKVNNEYADSAAIDADIITDPSPPGCFTCHSPHTNGNFDLAVANGTSVTTETGAVYSKSGGNICASCHVMRLGNSANANAYVLAAVQAGDLKSYAGYWGPHHGPQADMLLGYGGATYSGQTYSNSPHTGSSGATCVVCHMSYDTTSRYSLSPGVGGHSFDPAGIVHGAPAGSAGSCNNTACHGTGTISASIVGAFGAPAADGYLIADDVVFVYNTEYSLLNSMLKLFANPGACGGLLQSMWADAGVNGGGTISWSGDGRCYHEGFSASLAADGSATDTSAKTRFAKALWNFKFVYNEDRSFGNHNFDYAMQLLYDSCVDLNTYLTAGVDCTLGGTYTR